MASSSTINIIAPYQEALKAISAAIQSSNLPLASRLADQALSRGIQHPIVFNARALWFQERGRYEDALLEYNRSLALQPDDSTLQSAIGLCLLNLKRMKEALAAFDKAIAIDPRVAQTHYCRGWVLSMLGEEDAAQTAYERAIDLEAGHSGALACLASTAAKKGEAQIARDYAERALKIDPYQPTALAALASLDIAARSFAAAEARLRPVLDKSKLVGRARAVVLGLLGDSLEGQGRFPEAFAAYTAENAELRQWYMPQFATSDRAVDLADRIGTYFESAPAEQWRPPDDGRDAMGGTAQHIFLLGFMRSGTTLLEQVLASSTETIALEEQELLSGSSEAYLTSEERLNRLAYLNGEALARARNAYWKRIAERGLIVKDRIFIDKQPLHTLKLPLIAKLFPAAKILFALRDPRDVVLSCFRRHFEINAPTFEFLTLEGAARFYCAVMRLAELCRQKLRLQVHEHRYEDMIDNFERSVRADCGFIGVEWNDSMRKFNETVPIIPIRSPSAAQVKRALYRDSVGQWRDYRDQIAPILPMLQPWVERFQYPPS